MRAEAAEKSAGPLNQSHRVQKDKRNGHGNKKLEQQQPAAEQGR